MYIMMIEQIIATNVKKIVVTQLTLPHIFLKSPIRIKYPS